MEQVLGEEKGEVLCRYFDITPHGNFEHGRSVLNVPVPMEGIAKLFRMEVEAVREIVEEGRRRLFEAREGRVRPGRDDKVQTSWNGLMLSSFARAYAILGEQRYRIVAERSAAFIFDRLLKDGRLLHIYKDGQARFNGYLDDYSFFICGLIDLYEATFDVGWLRRALDLNGVMLGQFWDEADGGFFFTGKDHEKLLVRSKNPYDNAIPSGNSAAAHALLRLSALTGREDLRERGGSALRVFRDFMAEAPGGFAHALCALDFYLERPKEIALVGRKDGEDTKRLLATVYGRFLPNKVVCLLDPADGTEVGDLASLLKGKTQKEGRATAYVCQNFTCSAPVTEAGELGALLGG